ncbi:MAG: adenylate/guanylate cyclase domain-containing protein [Lachnospiraceae bacterium]|nr:adenylate/guanylate cyclase domain-containing protein [Lachnospiraceae bacterium]
MKKIIWVIGNDRNKMIEMQRKINMTGSMQALCMLSYEALQKVVASDNYNNSSDISRPSLIIIDYNLIVKSDFEPLSVIKKQRELAGVPLFFVVEKRSEDVEEECYAKGAMVILHKSFSKSEVMRIENAAWQYENTKNYEKMLQKQATDLKDAKEIVSLNRQLKTMNDLLYQVLGRYFSDDVVEVILEQPQGATIGGEKREVTVMMSDLRGFTSLSEEMEPETVTALLNFYFEKMLEAILKYHGTVIEFLGDGLLSVFGAPLDLDNPTSDAIAAAISMQNAMKEVNSYCAKQGYSELEMGIGIHCGEVFVGNIGSERMMRYNVIGRVVNECSRIESNSAGGQILVSEKAISKAGCPVQVAGRLDIIAKGLKKPIPAGEVVGIEGAYECYIEK